MEDRQIFFLLLIDGPNNGETSQCAQGTDQVSYYWCDTQKMVKLPKCNHSVDFSLSMNHCHGS